MKVKVERDIDVERLLINLSEKSKCKSVGMAGYDIIVSKQLLRDAHDVIKQLYTNKVNKPKYKIGQRFFIDDNWHISEKWLGRAYGIFRIYKIEDHNLGYEDTRYFLKCENNDSKICVSEEILERNKLL